MFILGKFIALCIQAVVWTMAIMMAITFAMIKGFMCFSFGFLFGAARGVKKWKF